MYSRFKSFDFVLDTESLELSILPESICPRYVTEPDEVEILKFRNPPGVIELEFPLEVTDQAGVGTGEGDHFFQIFILFLHFPYRTNW